MSLTTILQVIVTRDFLSKLDQVIHANRIPVFAPSHVTNEVSPLPIILVHTQFS